MVSEMEAAELFRPVTLLELKYILTLFKKERSPGPDGWTSEFFIHFFDLVGDDLLQMVEHSRINGKVLGSINSTFLALIPKENNSASFNDYRPISLCNLIYKISSKILSNRIKPFLERCLSAEQMGFLKGRRIQDAIGVAHEGLHSIKKKNIKALVLKLDLKKAFDSIDWGFLRLILLSVGFGIKMTDWMMACVSSASFAVLINGEATKFFRSERGLRQGCPLSPYLFILIMEGLSLLLTKNVSEQQISGIKVSNFINLVHLIFVDDVLLMSKASPSEWIVILELLQIFCSASGLSINFTKSTAHYWGLTRNELCSFKESLPFTFVDLSQGFKYLGYVLKPGAKNSDDWCWLVAKFERKISFWCNKWLSIGGRFILVNSVLHSISVFWMSLEKLPSSILNLLRRLSFNFLWNGQKDTHRFHLCSWNNISKPIKAGGWGLKNLAIFNTALLANSFWRALTHISLWHRVIFDKYLGKKSLIEWIRKPSLLQQRVSPFWKGLLSSSNVILHWLRWRPGSGKEISLGRDKILGLENRSLLPSSLRALLDSHNMVNLAQVRVNSIATPLPDTWFNSNQLNIGGVDASTWDDFTQALRSAGISLSNNPDTLIWAGGDATGSTTVKNIYLALIQQLNYQEDLKWFQRMWNWPIPLKIKIFVWLSAKEKTLTWDMLQKRGWEGPGICKLCNQSTEDIHHLLIHCHFTRAVWQRLLTHFSLNIQWADASVLECFLRWSKDTTAPDSLAAHACWQLWIERNKAIFEDSPPSFLSVMHRTLSAFSWQQSTVKTLPLKVSEFTPKQGFTVACFDGAASSNGLRCGAGGIFRFHPSRITKWFINCGAGTNTKAELLGLWATLTLASFWSIKYLHVLGDSRVIIDWVNHKCNLSTVNIEGWKQKIVDLAKNFIDLSVHHIYRAHNKEADALSKRALSEIEGRLIVFHSDHGRESQLSCINIFEMPRVGEG
jgi:ribonuclease HI